MVFQVQPGALHLLQDATAMGQQACARGRQGHTAAVAVKQALAQLNFQRAHLPTQRRLGHPQHAGGPGETAQFSDLDKVLQLFEVHGVWVQGVHTSHAIVAFQLVVKSH